MIVIIGAYGRTGSSVVKHVGRAEAVRLVSRNGARSPGSGAESVVASLTDEGQLRRAFRGARAAFVLLPDDFGSAAFHAERRAMVEAMTRALHREGVPRIVLLSSSAAALGERAGNGFGAELAYFERLLSESNASLTILRPCYFQDNVLPLVPAAAADGVFPNFFGAGGGKLATIAAADVGMLAARTLLEAPITDREVVDLIGPEYAPADMASLVAAAVGRPVRLMDVPRASQERAFEAWMSRDAARAMAETLECLSSGRILLRGERTLRGHTRLEQLLAGTRAKIQEVRP